MTREIAEPDAPDPAPPPLDGLEPGSGARPALTAALTVGLLVGLTTIGCTEQSSSSSFTKRHLSPPDNPFHELRSSRIAPQPDRQKPRAIVAAPERRRLYIALQGSIDHPGRTVVAVDPVEQTIVRRYRVGHGPTGLALHPDGRHLLVSNRYSNFLSIIDLARHRVRSHPSDFYVRRLTFSPSGDRLYGTNRWRDTLQIWDVHHDGERLRLNRRAPNGHTHGLPVGANPRDVSLPPDGSSIWVAARGGLTVSAFDAETFEPIDLRPGHSSNRLYVGAPPNDLTLRDDRLYIPTLANASGHPPDKGPDTDRDGRPGDSTPNTNFNDVQNELAVYSISDRTLRVRYTSDSICCPEVDDVSPENPELGEHLPSKDKWIVEGARPERSAVVDIEGESHLIVAYAGSNQLQKFGIQPDGTLRPGPTLATDFQPAGLAVDPGRGEAYVTNRLSETLTIVDLPSFEVRETIVVGDTSGGEFPATDAEIGELFFFAGAGFSVDGDVTCAHCHPQRGAIGKTFHMPLLADPRGTRNTPDARGLFRSRPWFYEGALDVESFDREVNRAAKRENFCCADFPDREDCASSPPEACQSRSFPSHFPTRDAFFLDRAGDLLDRTESFGDSRSTMPLDRDGMVAMLTLFLLQNAALLPNPTSPEAPQVRRGRRLFNSSTTGCAGCHRPPGFMRAMVYHPAPWVFGPVVTPNRSADGRDLDRVKPTFVETTTIRQNPHPRFKATSLLGLWDRPAPFLHDGRADDLLEAVATPNHPALSPDQTGYNELRGLPDTHGGTSHLSRDELAALIAYLRSL